MEFESIEQMQMVYETLKNIDIAITRLQERTVQIHTVDDFLLSPFGMEKLDAACMVIIALGEAVKTLDKLTGKQLLPTYPTIDWKKVMGARDIMAHHYFEVDADEVFSIIKNDLEPLKQAIDYFKKQLFTEQ
ncbi:MAG: DUF86 domain-containing protein [Bacteroidaceae bacterium]|nr:DUF86 domain-containing protein [Bacteroidaceae bacterium]